MISRAVFASVLVAAALNGCAASTRTSTSGASATATTTARSPAPPASASRAVTTASGLQYEDLEVGDGTLAERGMEVLVHYTGWFTNGRKFDSSIERQKPYMFRLGSGDIIPGWNEGVEGMRVGGRRKLIVPPRLAYGAEGKQGIPPDATLVFEIDLLDAR